VAVEKPGTRRDHRPSDSSSDRCPPAPTPRSVRQRGQGCVRYTAGVVLPQRGRRAPHPAGLQLKPPDAAEGARLIAQPSSSAELAWRGTASSSWTAENPRRTGGGVEPRRPRGGGAVDSRRLSDRRKPPTDLVVCRSPHAQPEGPISTAQSASYADDRPLHLHGRQHRHRGYAAFLSETGEPALEKPFNLADIRQVVLQSTSPNRAWVGPGGGLRGASAVSVPA
jgi:hypothetical protein